MPITLQAHSFAITGVGGTLDSRTPTGVVVNNPPVFATIPAQTRNVGTTFSIASYGSDPDGDALTYSRTGGTAPAGVTVSSAGSVSILTDVPAGNYTVIVQASDGRGGTASTTFTLTAVVVTSTTFGRVLFDNFETGSRAAFWTQDEYRNMGQVVTAAGVMDAGPGPDTGTYMWRGNWDGVAAWNSPQSFDTMKVDPIPATNEYLMRIRFRVDAGCLRDDGSGAKMFRLFKGLTSTNSTVRTAAGLSVGVNLNGVQFPTYWGGAVGDNTNNSASWHTWEMYANYVSGVFRVWHDNVLVVDVVGDLTGAGKPDAFYLLSNFGGAHDSTNYVYVDNVEVFSDTGTGGTGSMADGTATIAPTTYAGYTPTIYAAPTALGNGSGSSEANAMALSTALSAGTLNSLPNSANRVIGLLPGLYVGAVPLNRFDPSWKPAVTGTAGSRIVIVAKYPATSLGATDAEVAASSNKSELRNGAPAANWYGPGPTFGQASGTNYIDWIGVYVKATLSPTGNSAGVGQLHATTGSSIKKCVLVGHQISGMSANDNRCTIFVEDANNCEIADNLIYTMTSNLSTEDHSGIVTYNANVLDVHHNTFILTGSPGFNGSGCEFKAERDGYQTGCHFRYNVVKGGLCNGGVVYGSLQNGTGTPVTSLCEFNLFDGVGQAVYEYPVMLREATPGGIRNITIRRNTALATRNTSSLRGLIGLKQSVIANLTCQDNLLYNTNTANTNFIYDGYDGGGSHTAFAGWTGLIWRNNVGWNGSTGWAEFLGNSYTLAQMQAAGVDSGSVKLASTTNVFQNFAGANYRPGSAVATLSSTGGPVGCFEVSGGEVPGHRV